MFLINEYSFDLSSYIQAPLIKTLAGNIESKGNESVFSDYS